MVWQSRKHKLHRQKLDMGWYHDDRYRYRYPYRYRYQYFVLSIIDTRYHNGRSWYSIPYFFTSYNYFYWIKISEKCIHPWTNSMQYNNISFNTCMRLQQPFYIIQHSDIKSKVLCSVWISLQLITMIHPDVKYRKVSKSTRYRYRIFGRYRYFEIGPIPDTSSTRYQFCPISNKNVLRNIIYGYFQAMANFTLIYMANTIDVMRVNNIHMRYMSLG